MKAQQMASAKTLVSNQLGQRNNPQQKKIEKVKKTKIVSFFQLYRFADTSDKLLIFFGIIFAFATGCGFPFFGYIWGKVTDSYALPTLQETVDDAAHYRDVFLLIGAGTLILGWIAFTCWIIVGQRMALKCRKAYLQSLLRQQMEFYDLTSQYKISSQFQSDTILYQRAIGQKVGSLIMIGAMFICGAAIAFSVRWTMTLIIFVALPFLGVAGFLFIYLIELKNINFLKFYKKAGGRAQQAISAIRTVKMLNGQQHEYRIFQRALTYIAKRVPKYSIYGGIGSGLFYIAQFFAYAWAFWFGSHCAQNTSVCSTSVTGSRYTAGEVVSCFFALFVGSYNFMQLVPSIQKVYGGMLAAYRLFQVIDREPMIKSPINSLKIQNLKGVIKFQNVSFAYPKDKSTQILNNLNLQLNVLNDRKSSITNSNALVGESGCGKSTILQLIMRFYDPDSGKITVDGIDLKQLDLNWFRNQIGYVGQEPVLFATSIKENIKYGKPNATDDEINHALKKAQAYDFVQSLQDKENTYVGYGGGQLSGGQKQRIAIARAIIRNPKIFILDQATSALDRKNERLIQKTLDTIIEGRTSITVAHRVKTIMHCNKIYVLDKGKLVESGKFEDIYRYKDYRQQKQQQFQQKQGMIKQKEIQQEQKIYNIHNKDEIQIQQKGLSQQEKIQKQEAQIRKKYSSGIYWKLFSYTKGQRLKLLLGSICAVGAGAIYPVFTIFIAQMVIGTFQLNDGNTLNDEQARTDVNRNALIITLIGILAFFLNMLQYFLFSIVGQKVTQKIRLQSYQKILRMPICWFDMPRNSGSSVAGRLSVDSQIVNGLTSLLFAVMLHNLATIVAAFVISFIYSWRVGIVGLVVMPLMLLAGFISMKFYGGFGDKSEEVYKSSSRLVSESVINIKTVKALAYQQVLTSKYDQFLVEPRKFAVKKGNIIGILYGLSQFFIFFSFAFLFWFGSLFRRDNADVEVIDIFTAIFAIVWAGWTAGNNFFFMPDIAQGQKAAANLFYLLDRSDQAQCQVIQQSKLLKSGIRGNIIFDNVSFKYPSRTQYVFKNINLNIKQGDKIAFVGPSGCGKSTIINLILRFYFQTKGNIIIDGHDIADYDINYLRSCFGVVGQEPVLFNGSFKNNIKYNSNVTDQQILQAAKKANTLSFILDNQADPKFNVRQQEKQQMSVLSDYSQDPIATGKGFDKNVGMRGSHISGGQKQRVAIARAILKKPQILLLDQATSALDSVNQKIVQQSLDKIMQGKTSVNIAHRIDTIKNSKEIYVFNQGRIVEKGAYKDLVKKEGYFYMLQRGINLS